MAHRAGVVLWQEQEVGFEMQQNIHLKKELEMARLRALQERAQKHQAEKVMHVAAPSLALSLAFWPPGTQQSGRASHPRTCGA